MKKNIYTIVAILLGSVSQAQDISDALLYAKTDINGTARYNAMAGAFGAVGGDLSAINYNPAGSAIFANNVLTFTLNTYSNKNNSTYFDKKTSDEYSNLALNQVGAVITFLNENKQSDWKKVAFAINYDNQNNYGSKIFSAGINPKSSVVDYFLDSANGVSLKTLDNVSFSKMNFKEQQAYLAYNTYLLNPDKTIPTNTTYSADIAALGNFYQENEVVTTGYNGKLSFNASGSYKDKLYLGLNLNSHFSNYTKSSSIYEDYNDAIGRNPVRGAQAIRLNNNLNTSGRGFSFQIGGIYKITSSFRVGATYQSPTWLSLTDQLSQVFMTDYSNNSKTCDPNYQNIYAPYSLKTPRKLTASFAYVFGKKGLISVDLSNKSYKHTTLSPNNEFVSVNSKIQTLFYNPNFNLIGIDGLRSGEITEVRVGAERKIKQWSLRAGYHWERSPYLDKNLGSDTNQYSGGLGYNLGGTRIDFSYATNTINYKDTFLPYGTTGMATINKTNNNYTLSLSFDF